MSVHCGWPKRLRQDNVRAHVSAGLRTVPAIRLFFLWIPTVDVALARIADRVRRGGHDVPEQVVRRRFQKGVRNLFTVYRPLLDLWMLFDNSGTEPRLIAREEVGALRVFDQNLMAQIMEAARR